MILEKNSKLKKLFSLMIIYCVCVISVFTSCNRRNKEAVSRNSDSAESIEYVALGDSIPNGYSVLEDDGLTAYPQLLAEAIEMEEEITVNLSRYTKNGLTTNGLYEKYLSDAKVQEDLKKADLITVTIGANDILNKFRELYRETFDEDIDTQDKEAQRIRNVLKNIQNEISDDPKLLAEAAETIYGWDCDEFEEDWRMVMEHISRSRKKEAKVIVTMIYDPVGEIEALGVLNQVTAALIGEMNEIISENAEVYGYQAADVSEIRTGQYLQSDGLHPDQQGQRLIMEKIREKY